MSSNQIHLSQKQWLTIYDDYLVSGLSKGKFYEMRLQGYCPDGKRPCKSSYFRNLRAIEGNYSDQEQAQTQNSQVSIVELSDELYRDVGLGPIEPSTRGNSPLRNKRSIRLILPNDIKVEFETPSPEGFMLSLLTRFIGEL